MDLSRHGRTRRTIVRRRSARERDRIRLMHTDTIAIIVAILGVGLGLWRAIATIRQDVTTLRHEVRADISGLRQEMAEIRQDVRSLPSRIDNLYQALFSHKDPAA